MPLYSSAVNLTDELSKAKEQHLNHFGTAVLVRCGKSVWCDKSSTESVELNLGLTHDVAYGSVVTPVSLQSRNFSVRFST